MKVKVLNRKRRTFMAEIPNEPVGTKRVVRSTHNPKTGEISPYLTEITLYKTIRLAPNESVELEEAVLDGPGFKQAIKEKWLRVVR